MTMTLKKVCVGLVAIGAIVASTTAMAAEPVRAGAALPEAAQTSSNHIFLRTIKTAGHKQHLQGEDSSGNSTNWIIPVLGIAAIGGGIAAAVSNSDSKPDSN
jgi:hypothetical protein